MTITPLERAQAEQAAISIKIIGSTIWILSVWTIACAMLGHWSWW